MSEEAPRAAVVTVSSSRAGGGGAPDESGEALAGLVAELGGAVVERLLLPDERGAIETALRELCDGGGCDLVLTSGGTGFAPSDVTPEATEAVLERRAPGIAEAMRAASAPHTKHWMLSRATAGVRGRCLVVNFPGNPRAIAETAAAILPALPHAISLLREAPTPHRA
jgi:molybdenum cofactor synthesis domain-containing protein